MFVKAYAKAIKQLVSGKIFIFEIIINYMHLRLVHYIAKIYNHWDKGVASFL
jgi:hypothetical protein